MTKELITAKELAHHLDIRVNIIYNWIAIYNDVPYHRVNNKIRFNREEIQNWLQGRKDKRENKRKENIKYYALRDKIKFLMADLVIAKIDIKELDKIYNYISSLEATKQLKGANNND